MTEEDLHALELEAGTEIKVSVADENGVAQEARGKNFTVTVMGIEDSETGLLLKGFTSEPVTLIHQLGKMFSKSTEGTVILGFHPWLIDSIEVLS